jgi:hypothetical protein
MSLIEVMSKKLNKKLNPTVSFMRCLAQESSNLPFTHQIITSVTKIREFLSSGDKSIIGVEPSSRTLRIISILEKSIKR